MTLTDFPALAKLPKKKKLQLSEELWFAGVDDSLSVSAAHKKILATRWQAYQSGNSKRITMTELERRLSKK